ncbi:M23 peptidase domain protein [gamma proteobacterium HTCC5015]|nr:M23 peptidase domain protein [gamma proteobacterium HTCC5015]
MKPTRKHLRRGATRSSDTPKRHWSLNWRLHSVIIMVAAISSVLFLTESEDTQASSTPATTSQEGITLALPQERDQVSEQESLLPPQKIAPPTTASTLAAPRSEPAAPTQEAAATSDAKELPDQPTTTASDKALEWQTARVKSGDSLARIAYRADIKASEIHHLMNTDNEAIQTLTRIRPGDELRYRSSASGDLLALEYDTSDTERLSVIKNGDQFAAEVIARPYDVFENRISATIDSSLFGTAKAAGLSDNLIMELANIFGYDIDFALDVRHGDTFTVIWKEYFRNGEKIKDGDIIAAEFINNGRTVRGVRYTDASGHTDYYAPNGDSLRKAFIRSPVHFTRISSKFNPNRLHPIYKTRRPHRGVDYAARTGTPIMAAGDGKVIFRGKKGGYGNCVIIQHGQRYNTLYAHMSSFNRKVGYGTRVKQGQVIGYVGATGWATGPHLHYEFRVNGVHRNPLTVKLPSAEPLKAQYKADFERFSQPLMAQLNTLTRTQLALNSQ